MARRLLVPFAAVALVAVSFACGPAIPGPPTGKHPGLAAVVKEVEFPPPPAVSEVVPPRPADERCVWLDGSWDWVGGRWEWQSGGWVVPPKGCYFRPATLSWPQAGALRLIAAHWYPDNVDELEPERAQAACPAPVSCGRPARKYRPGTR
jgi:hypothetical protein